MKLVHVFFVSVSVNLRTSKPYGDAQSIAFIRNLVACNHDGMGYKTTFIQDYHLTRLIVSLL